MSEKGAQEQQQLPKQNKNQLFSDSPYEKDTARVEVMTKMYHLWNMWQCGECGRDTSSREDQLSQLTHLVIFTYLSFILSMYLS